MTKQSAADKEQRAHTLAVRMGLERLDRHSGAGGSSNPNPKKGGQGKFNWGAPGAEEDYVEILDDKDPNYDPDEPADLTEKPTENRVDMQQMPEAKVEKVIVENAP